MHYVANRTQRPEIKGEKVGAEVYTSRQALEMRHPQKEVILRQEAVEDITEEEPAKEYEGNVEVIEMDRMRKLIAKHMVNSKQTSAHVTSFAEADVTNMVLWRERVKKDFEKQNNARITFTPIFIDCLVRVMKRYPIINSSVDGDKIIVKKDFNIGMATALPAGNLIVPVIKNADELNLVGLTKRVNNLAEAARNNDRLGGSQGAIGMPNQARGLIKHLAQSVDAVLVAV